MRLAGCFPDVIGAAVFDMDGVLADTEPLHDAAFAAVLASYGGVVTSEEYAYTVGRDSHEIWEWVRERWAVADPVPTLAAAFERSLLPRLARVAPAPGARALIDDLRLAGVPLALASSSSRRIVDHTLRTLGFEAAFAATVAGDEVSPSKPHPAIYLAAAAHLGVGAERCIAIEDSVLGMQAARAAGMKVVGIRNRYIDGEPPADVVIGSLDDLLT
jgi:HAD superfamily hydrolase (TIGR01509 family)